jgi:hypothetical protein
MSYSADDVDLGVDVSAIIHRRSLSKNPQLSKINRFVDIYIQKEEGDSGFVTLLAG